MREWFLSDLQRLISETSTSLLEAVDQCCHDIRSDLDILRGEQVAAARDDGILDAMLAVLDTAKNELDNVIRNFEAQLM